MLDDDKLMAVFLEEFGLPKFELSDKHDKWKSYIGTSGTFVENVHDYVTVELDDSLEKHINKLKKTRLY